MKIHSHVHRHHAVQIVTVVNTTIKQYAHVNRVTLVHHHNVVPNVSFHQNVHRKKHASTINALILVHIHAVSMLSAIHQITIQFVLVRPVLPVIHLLNAFVYVSLIVYLNVPCLIINF